MGSSGFVDSGSAADSSAAGEPGSSANGTNSWWRLQDLDQSQKKFHKTQNAEHFTPDTPEWPRFTREKIPIGYCWSEVVKLARCGKLTQAADRIYHTSQTEGDLSDESKRLLAQPAWNFEVNSLKNNWT